VCIKVIFYEERNPEVVKKFIRMVRDIQASF
jgi:hypothetical protein